MERRTWLQGIVAGLVGLAFPRANARAGVDWAEGDSLVNRTRWFSEASIDVVFTRDGVPIRVGMELWDQNDDGSVVSEILFTDRKHHDCGDSYAPEENATDDRLGAMVWSYDITDGQQSHHPTRTRWWVCYSTRDAAMAARASRQPIE